MRILLTSNYFPEHPGGVEFVAARQAAGYRQLGHEVRWLAADCGPRPHRAPGDVPLRAWNLAERRLGFPYPLPSPAALAGIRAHASWADAIHVNDSLYALSIAAALHAGRLGRPLLVTQHVPPIPYSNFVLRGLQAAAYLAAGNRVLATAGQVAFVSERVATAHAGIRLRRPAVVVENAIDTDLFRPLGDAEREEVRRGVGAAETPLALFAGRFVEKKGYGRIVEAARSTPEVRWLMVGPGGATGIRSAPPNLEVRAPVAQAELARLYSAADLLVLPSVGEGFPVAVQEALACGTPALVHPTTAGALPGLEHVLFVETGDLAGAVLDALARAASRRTAAAELAAARWSTEVMAARYERLLAGIGAPSPRTS